MLPSYSSFWVRIVLIIICNSRICQTKVECRTGELGLFRIWGLGLGVGLDNMFMLMIFPGIPFGFDFVSVWIEHSYGTGETFAYRLTLDSINLLTVIFKFDILLHHKNICSFRESSYLLPSAVRKQWLKMCLINSDLFSPIFLTKWRGVTWENVTQREEGEHNMNIRQICPEPCRPEDHQNSTM